MSSEVLGAEPAGATVAPTSLVPPCPARVSRRNIERFDRVERAAHWANATLFIIVMVTAVPLYFGSISGIFGRRELIAQIHTWAGVALPVPLIITLAGPWGARFRHDLRRVNRWTAEELRWLRTLGSQHLTRPDKLNPGQKLNTAFTGGVILVMLASGSVMRWNDHFPLSWRTGATFVHDVVAWMAFAVVTGHVVMAVTHPGAMISMLTGKVSRQWAAIHARGWLDEIDRGSQGDELGRGGCGSQGDELGAASQDVGTER